jgi:plasmid rolling circle replication initiator protein Rep
LSYTGDKNNIKTEVLQDLDKKGRKRPWRPKKVRSLILADSFKRLGYDKKSERVRFCSYELGFYTDPETLEKRLKSARFCRERLCPMCQWRRSIKVFKQVSKVMDVATQRHSELVPIFLTLTMRNCTGDELPEVLDKMFLGWKNLINHRKIKRVLEGWFRALEVTYDGDKVISQRRYDRRKEEYDRKGIKAGDINPNYDTYHPHFHVILLVQDDYFTGKDYMQTSDWVHLWRTSAGLDYDPICDIRKVKNRPGKAKNVADVAKYTLKDTEYLKKDPDLTDKLVGVLGGALRNRRLYAFGGLLKKIAAELDIGELADGDLIHTDDDAIREDVATAIVFYRWTMGISDYVKVRG